MKFNAFTFCAICLLIIDKVLAVFQVSGLFLFPALAVYYFLKNQEYEKYLGRFFLITIFFDYFSGLPFGALTLLLAITIFSIMIASHFLAFSGSSFMLIIIFSAFFLSEFLFLLNYVVHFSAITETISVFMVDSLVFIGLVEFYSIRNKLS